ncbi:MAG: LysR family transcriptional regulator, partial [Oscillospiraceae bacterium]|nr:LysR family transcriptional regulator [Oscillospiraceae bacterium]
FSPIIEAATSYQILPMVKNDLGIGFVPEEYLETTGQEDNVFVLDLKEEIPERFICLVERRDHHLSMAAKMLRAVILENIQI